MSASILKLPPELLNQVLEESDYASGLALRYTCKRLYLQTSTPGTLGSAAAQHSSTNYNMSDLLQLEMWPCYDHSGQHEGNLKQAMATRDFFACSLCLKIRCASKFSNAMMKGRRGKHSGAPWTETTRHKRFCIDCGMRYGKYLPGVMFEFGGAPIIHVEYNVGARFPSVRHEVGGRGYGLVCKQCRQFTRLNHWEYPPGRLCQACCSHETTVSVSSNCIASVDYDSESLTTDTWDAFY